MLLKYAPFVVAASLWLPVSSAQAVPVITGVLSTLSNADALYDGVAATSVALPGDGSASLLLDTRGGTIEAVGVLGVGGALRVLVSANYRDWRYVGSVAPGQGEMQVVAFDPLPVRFVRVDQSDGSGGAFSIAEIAAGSAQDVADAATLLTPFDWGDVTQPATIHAMMDATYQWQRTRLSDETGWISATFHAGTMALYNSSQDERYRQDLIAYCESQEWKLPTRTGTYGLYLADDHCMAQTYLELFEASPGEREEAWIADSRARFDMIMADPLQGRVDYYWCDALFMAPPAYVRMAAVTGNSSYLEFIDQQFQDATEFLYDTEEHLYYRDANYFAAVEANGEPVFWSRGNGWVIAGLARMLEYMPVAYEGRPYYLTLFREMAARLASIQQPDGLWTSSLLYPERFSGEPEASGSAFFIYALAWGVNQGVLDGATYGPAIERGWAALTNLVLEDGRIMQIQQPAAAPGKVNDSFAAKDYGYGAFLLAGAEMVSYYGNKSGERVIAHASTASPAPHAPAAASFTPPAGDPDAWQLIAGFEQGGLAGWTVRNTGTGGGSATPVPDPYGPATNTVLRVDPGTTQGDVIHCTLPLAQAPASGVATLYLRFATSGPGIDAVWGFSDESVVDAWGDFEATTRLSGDPFLDVRSGGDYLPVTPDFLELLTWQELWIVADLDTDTFDVYIAGGAQRRGIEQIVDGATFRNGAAANPLRSFAVVSHSFFGNDPLYLDDVHVSTGANLTRPAGVTSPAISVYADSVAYYQDGLRWSPQGWLYDGWYPWVYCYGDNGWWWILHDDQLQAAPAAGWYAWSTGDAAGWLWTGSSYGKWLYSYSATGWTSLPGHEGV